MITISNEQLEKHLGYDILIPQLKAAFAKKYNIPKRHHHQYPNPAAGVESTLLLMPAWDDGNRVGVKLVTVSQLNSGKDLPTIQGLYILFDLETGTPIAQMDAKLLTNKRTAATSALASTFLSRPDCKSMLMIGTGAMSSELIEAHTFVRPIERVFVWGRNFEKACEVAAALEHSMFEVIPVRGIDKVIHECQLISCATLSQTPLLSGASLTVGQHYDLVGAYKPDMREADDEFISSVSIHVDTWEGASTETGDLVIPLRTRVISKEHLSSELFELCSGVKPGRRSMKEVTCFKSVGHALEDLAAASLVYDSLNVSTGNYVS